jgi:hypothetical protein
MTVTNNREGSAFPAATIRRLAMRAGYRCSMSGCRALTAGPSEESPSSVINVGVATHIHSEAEGRRYNPSMPPEERKDISNGIWLCWTHSVEIDRDEVKYTATSLRQMKEEHERFIAAELNAGRAGSSGSELIAVSPEIRARIARSARTNAERLEDFASNCYDLVTANAHAFEVSFRLPELVPCESTGDDNVSVGLEGFVAIRMDGRVKAI